MNGPRIFLWAAFLFSCVWISGAANAAGPRHYIFFNRDRERITEPSFVKIKQIEGAQLKYTWRELEPVRDRYDFTPIANDLDTLRKSGKRLWIQLQDSSFDERIINVPKYLLEDAVFNGGAARQYAIENDDDATARPEGWVARRWDPAVQARFAKLLGALGREFDGKIEGINLPETSVGFGESGKLYPQGFSPELYRDAVITNMVLLRRAFPGSIAMQYANFMPGEWRPEKDRGFLSHIYETAVGLRVALGAPDLLPHKPGQMKHAYSLLPGVASQVPTGVAVQWGNYEHIDPRTSRRVTIEELATYATTELKVTYLFWCAQEPFYSSSLLPYLQQIK
jgi:hypothetical protein